MISERVLKGQTDKLYFCTSLAPPNVIPLGSLALLLSPSTTTTQTSMDLPAPDVEGCKGGNTSACYQQLLQVIAASSGGGGRQQTGPPACVCLRNCLQGRLRVLPAQQYSRASGRHEPRAKQASCCQTPGSVRSPPCLGDCCCQDSGCRDKTGLYYWQQVSQPREIIFLLALHACYMNARSYSCSL